MRVPSCGLAGLFKCLDSRRESPSFPYLRGKLLITRLSYSQHSRARGREKYRLPLCARDGDSQLALISTTVIFVVVATTGASIFLSLSLPSPLRRE